MTIKDRLKKIAIVRYIYFRLLSVIRYANYLVDFKKFNALLFNKLHRRLEWSERYVCLNDKTNNTSFDTHYVYHTAWAARKLKEITPFKHIDISSSIYFNAIASAFVPIEFYDYRPAKVNLDNLSALGADLLALPFQDHSIDSLSCMHVIEHIGLGRYGDPLDAMGDKKAAQELQRVLADNANLLIVVPVGKPNINFNAHRVYGYDEVMDMFSQLNLVEFSLLTDDEKGAEFFVNASPSLVKEQRYGCGCFWFCKGEKKI